MTTRTKPPTVLTAMTLVALAVATWWVFLGWDTIRNVDPATGSVTGPYEAPQVIACVIVLVGLVAVGTLMLPAWLAVLGVALPVTAAWTIQAASSDDSGLFVIGAALVLAGALGGGAIVAAVTRGVAGRQNTDPTRRDPCG